MAKTGLKLMQGIFARRCFNGRRRIWSLLSPICIALWPVVPCVAETATIGKGGLDWRSAASDVSFFDVDSVRIQIWPSTAGANLATGISDRHGFVLAGSDTTNRHALLAFDGDPGTVYDPDLVRTLSRQSSLLIDLGGTFGVDRVRLFPRLDSSHRGKFPQEFVLKGWSLLGGWDLLSFRAPSGNTAPIVEASFPRRFVSG
jgi:hypothetical protein